MEELKQVLKRAHELGLTRTYAVSSARGTLYVHHCGHGDPGEDYNLYTRRWDRCEWPSDWALLEDASLEEVLAQIKKSIGNRIRFERVQI